MIKKERIGEEKIENFLLFEGGKYIQEELPNLTDSSLDSDDSEYKKEVEEIKKESTEIYSGREIVKKVALSNHSAFQERKDNLPFFAKAVRKSCKESLEAFPFPVSAILSYYRNLSVISQSQKMTHLTVRN